MIIVQLSYTIFFFFNDQPLNLFSYMWTLNIQGLILKKVVIIVQKLY
jgi:hypothetical protein